MIIYIAGPDGKPLAFASDAEVVPIAARRARPNRRCSQASRCRERPLRLLRRVERRRQGRGSRRRAQDRAAEALADAFDAFKAELPRLVPGLSDAEWDKLKRKEDQARHF